MICGMSPQEAPAVIALLEKEHYTILECSDHQAGLYGLTLVPEIVIVHLEPEELVPSLLATRLRNLLSSLGESTRIFASFNPEACEQRIRRLGLPFDGVIPLRVLLSQAA